MVQPTIRKRLSAALLAALAAPGLVSVAPAPSTTWVEDESSEQAERVLERVLTLPGGTTLRGLTRRNADGDWEWKRNGRWQTVPATVERSRSVRELLAQKRRMEAELDGSSAHAQRCALADWMLSSGLLVEGMKTLDYLLGERATPCASRVIHDHGFRFRIPRPLHAAGATDDAAAALEELLAYAAGSPPALRELCIQEATQHIESEELVELLLLQLVDPKVVRRSLAAFALGSIEPGEGALGPLLQRAVLDTSRDVRANAQATLRVANEPSVTLPVLRALHASPSPRVRLQATEALGNLGYVSAVPSMIARLAALQSSRGSAGRGVPHSNIFTGRQIAYLQDFDVEVAQGQAIGDPQINVALEGQVTDVGVVSVKTVRTVSVERSALNRALERLTGASPGRTSQSWATWWEEEGKKHLSTRER